MATAPVEQAQTAAAITEAPVVKAPAPKHQNGRRIASPRARRCASQNNIALNAVTGTGENGRIIEQDVLDYIASQTTTSVRIPKDEVVPLSGMRKVIASRMRNSLQEMAQTNTRMDVDMTNMIAFRKQINDRLSKDGVKVSYVDLLVAVCAKALIENPLANASLEADGIHYKNYANIGIAVDAAKGLVVPVIKDADIRTIPEISQISKELINKARDGALRPDDMKGGTFTISNLGMFEVDSFTAIVNPPETCILAVGRIAEKPVVVDGQIVIRSMMNLCLSYDHRVIDGAPSARFLQCIKHYIENPVWLLM
jgi:pyruvate/2-oxoglutarate dehydrogenase complex dihydrolipoamide acyltransferase (E2) component